MDNLWYLERFTDENGEFMYETNPVQAIKKKCKFDCCSGDEESWKNCNCTTCFLWPFRLGKNPYRSKREISDEQKNKMKEALKKAREARFSTVGE